VTRSELLAFMRRSLYAVEATVSPTRRTRPLWIRFSSFAADPPRIVEFPAADLTRLADWRGFDFVVVSGFSRTTHGGADQLGPAKAGHYDVSETALVNQADL